MGLNAALTVQGTNPAGLMGVPRKGNNIVLILMPGQNWTENFALLNRNCAVLEVLSWQHSEQPKRILVQL